jgi:hypothetical protein
VFRHNLQKAADEGFGSEDLEAGEGGNGRNVAVLADDDTFARSTPGSRLPIVLSVRRVRVGEHRQRRKGTNMKRNHWLVVGVLLAVAATVLLAQQGSPGALRRWEYAVYMTGLGQNGKARLWQRSSGRAGVSEARRDYISGDEPYEFCKELGIPYSVPISMNTQSEKLAFELVVLDYFGDQGWELISAPTEQGAVQKYHFRRIR